MRLLIYSGLLYLLGISIILVLRPNLMFSKDGQWKEFGIGRNKNKYTWMPFWLFALIWAIISYIIVLTIAGSTILPGADVEKDISVSVEEIEPENLSKKNVIESVTNSLPKKKISKTEMKTGYYILDTQETIKKGVPKYIYLGPEAPNLIYSNAPETDLN